MSRPYDPTAILPPTMPLAGLSVQQASLLFRGIVEEVLESRYQADLDGSRPISLIAAAKLARRRQQVVREALICGALKGECRGGRWAVSVAAVRAWILAGYPVKP